MKLTAAREDVLAPLQSVIGVVERRQTMPVLANVLLSARENRLSVTGTDLEVELVATSQVTVPQAGDITVPGRKLLDIFRSLPEKTSVTLSTEGERVSLRAGRSRFTLSSLPAAEFPVVEEINAQQTLSLEQGEFRRLIDKTHFSMRLALCETELKERAKIGQQVIVPRKGVLELQRILGTEGAIELAIGTNHVRAQIGDIRFTSKLIDGRFPEYGRVIPSSPGRTVAADREALRQALQRTAILSNEKYRGIRLTARTDLLMIQAHNPEQEEAEDQVEVAYKGEEVEIGFNVNYLLDALGAIESDKVEIGLTDSNSSCLIHAPGVVHTRYVVMPMRL
ncbi:MAG: DNA polymerase III subunit beta [Gammaproteobacteria bacterium]|nr:MAG: DNA polymerase III subunit beta [Gammaproteobacteria bacterium]